MPAAEGSCRPPSSSPSSSSPRSPPSPGRSGSSATRWSSTASPSLGSRTTDPAPRPRLHPQRGLPLRPDADPLPHHPVRRGTIQIVKPGGKLVVTLARDAFLKRYSSTPTTGTAAVVTTARATRPLQAAGQAAPSGPRAGATGRDAPARAQPLPPDEAGDWCPVLYGRKPVSDVLAGAGVLLAAAAAAAAILLPPGRAARRGDARRSRPLPDPDPRRPVALPSDRRSARQTRSASSALGVAGRRRPRRRSPAIFGRWPFLLPLAIVAALPFRVPLEAGGDTANLLVPLYLVIAGGVLATAFRDWRPATRLCGWRRRGPPPRKL